MKQSETSAKNSSAYKYKLTELLAKYPAASRRPIKLLLCQELQIGESTWGLWANYKIDAHQSMPLTAGMHIAERFGLSHPSELCNSYKKAEPIQLKDLQANLFQEETL